MYSSSEAVDFTSTSNLDDSFDKPDSSGTKSKGNSM
jgi:hypothetical protein